MGSVAQTIAQDEDLPFSLCRGGPELFCPSIPEQLQPGLLRCGSGCGCSHCCGSSWPSCCGSSCQRSRGCGRWICQWWSGNPGTWPDLSPVCGEAPAGREQGSCSDQGLRSSCCSCWSWTWSWSWTWGHCWINSTKEIRSTMCGLYCEISIGEKCNICNIYLINGKYKQ